MPREAAGQPPPAFGWADRLAVAARRALPLARAHWLLTALLVAGLALRVAAQVAYRPALFYIDSVKYLFGAYAGDDPPGYQLIVQPLRDIVSPPVMVAVQHLAGLAMAVALYALLRRRGAARWLSALAVAPVLLDAYQLQIEQTIMPDTAFEVAIVAGLGALLWRPRPGNREIVAAGLALGASATVRQVGEIFILPAVAYLVLTLPRWRRLLSATAILAVAFALPILGASFRDYVAIHKFALAPYAGGTIYGRLAASADCATLKLPMYEQALCPSRAQQRQGPDWLDHQATSPNRTYVAPVGMSRATTVGNFDRQVLLQQPWRVASAIGADAIKLFAVHRVTFPGDTSIQNWQFQTRFPSFSPYVTVNGDAITFAQLVPPYGLQKPLGDSQQLGGGPPTVVKPLAGLLRSYQLDGGYTPGPLLLFAVVAGLGGSLLLLRRRLAPARREAALACLLFFSSGAVVLLVSDVFEFSWRYQLPALVTLPPAAAFGLAALAGRTRRAAKPALPGTEAGHPAALVAPPGTVGPGGTPPNGAQARDRAVTS